MTDERVAQPLHTHVGARLNTRAYFAIGAVALIACAVGAVIWFANSGSPSRHTVSATVAVNSSAGGDTAALRAALAQTPRRAEDQIPRSLRRMAASVTTSAPPEFAQSRHVAGHGITSVYAWPAGSAICLGVANRAVRCSSHPTARGVGPILATARAGLPTLVAAVTAATPRAVTVNAGGTSCTALLAPNGFICLLPAGTRVTGATLTVRTRDGSVRTIPLT